MRDKERSGTVKKERNRTFSIFYPFKNRSVQEFSHAPALLYDIAAQEGEIVCTDDALRTFDMPKTALHNLAIQTLPTLNGFLIAY